MEPKSHVLHEVAITAIVVKEGKYLITRRVMTKKRFPGKWTVPGGRVQTSDYINLPKDTGDCWYNVLERVVRREVREEVGLEIKNIEYVTSLATIDKEGTPILVISCLAQWDSGEVVLQESETDKYAWITTGEAKDYELIGGIDDEFVMADERRRGVKSDGKSQSDGHFIRVISSAHMENTENSKFLPAAVIVAGLLIAGAVLWNGSRSATPGTAPTGGAPTVAVDIKNVKIDGDPYLGQANAPVTIAFWSDFQCPFCKKFELETLPQIIKEYVDTGKVKMVMMDFTFLGKDSTTAALYSRSVWKLFPDKYFAWRTAMYTAQDQEGDQGFGNAASIDTLDATIAGIDADKIAADVKANTATYQSEVDADRAEAIKVGVNATPGFVIGTQAILGAYPYENFKAAIDAVLK